MPGFTEEQAKSYITKLLTAMSQAGGSDLFVSKDFPPAMKLQGAMPAAHEPETLRRSVARARLCAHEPAPARGVYERAGVQFRHLAPRGGRASVVNVFVQQQNVGMVIRTIANEIPDFVKLGLPDTLKNIVMTKRGLVLVVGATARASQLRLPR